MVEESLRDGLKTLLNGKHEIRRHRHACHHILEDQGLMLQLLPLRQCERWPHPYPHPHPHPHQIPSTPTPTSGTTAIHLHSHTHQTRTQTHRNRYQFLTHTKTTVLVHNTQNLKHYQRYRNTWDIQLDPPESLLSLCSVCFSSVLRKGGSVCVEEPQGPKLWSHFIREGGILTLLIIGVSIVY